MTLYALLSELRSHPGVPLHLLLPGGESVPAHFHVTEVGRYQYDFVDCGGTARRRESCLLQAWTADDVEHRITTDKLLKILGLATSVLGQADMPVAVEYGPQGATHYGLSHTVFTGDKLVLTLEPKLTECLAPDKCGVTEARVPARKTITRRCGGKKCC